MSSPSIATSPVRLPSVPARADLRHSRLSGVGAARPRRSWSSAELGAPFGKSAQWIEARTGIKALRRLAADERAIALAREAGKAALTDAGISVADVDLVIAVSCSLGHDEIGDVVAGLTPGARSILLNAACSGFCYALATADSAIRVGDANTVLVLAAEHMSRMVDAADLGTAIIFGDGAGAAVATVAGDGEVGIGPVVWGSDGSGAHLIANAEQNGGMLGMAGQQVFRWAVDTMPALVARACAAAGVAPGDIDVFVPHQANLRIIDAIVRKAHLEHAVVADDITDAGNTSSASVPMALTRLLDEGRARSGDLALLLGFGAGLTYAGQVVLVP